MFTRSLTYWICTKNDLICYLSKFQLFVSNHEEAKGGITIFINPLLIGNIIN